MRSLGTTGTNKLAMKVKSIAYAASCLLLPAKGPTIHHDHMLEKTWDSHRTTFFHQRVTLTRNPPSSKVFYCEQQLNVPHILTINSKTITTSLPGS